MSEDHYVYMIGYEHGTFGHAIKVGVSRNVGSRMATLQTGCIDELQLYFAMRFASRDIAFQVERCFHESCLAGPVRGEWVGCNPEEALFYLTIIASNILRRRYAPDDLRFMREYAGLLDAFEVTDRIPSDKQGDLNDRAGMWLEEIDRRGYA